MGRPEPGWPRTRACGAVLAAAVVLSACRGDERKHGAAPERMPPPDYNVTAPPSWQRPPRLPRSTGLVFLSKGRSTVPGCPGPLLLVRRQSKPVGALAQAVALYNRIEQVRRPARRILRQQAVRIRGARQAVLIVARYPSQVSSGRPVRTYDLLALSDRDVAFHVYASACAADLPRAFVERHILSFNADALPRSTP